MVSLPASSAVDRSNSDILSFASSRDREVLGGALVPFVPTDRQRDLLLVVQAPSVCLVVDNPRQIGISTALSIAVAWHLLSVPSSEIVVLCSNERTSSGFARLLSRALADKQARTGTMLASDREVCLPSAVEGGQSSRCRLLSPFGSERLEELSDLSLLVVDQAARLPSDPFCPTLLEPSRHLRRGGTAVLASFFEPGRSWAWDLLLALGEAEVDGFSAV